LHYTALIDHYHSKIAGVVGFFEGLFVADGLAVRLRGDGLIVGYFEGLPVGFIEGLRVGFIEGPLDGRAVGFCVGRLDGLAEGATARDGVGVSLLVGEKVRPIGLMVVGCSVGTE
jgi:hypothetical protein